MERALANPLILWRPRPELNRGTRFCRPLRNHSATWPIGLGYIEEPKVRGNVRRVAPANQACVFFPPVSQPDRAVRNGREMTDFAQARRMMVEGQIRTNDVTDLRVLAAFNEVRRERFVPERWQAIAYLDRDVPVQETGGRCLLKPMVLAKLIQAAEVGEGDRVLDVGCATGYSSAVL